MGRVPELGLISEVGLRDVCCRLLGFCFEHGNYAVADDAPVLPDIPTTQASGIDHLRLVARIALATSRESDEILGVTANSDHVVAAALLHDMSKWFEYEPVEDAESGHRRGWLTTVLPHPQFGVALAHLAGLPPDIVATIAQHTPSTPVMTSTPLSVIVHHADMIAGDLTKMSVGLPATLKTITELPQHAGAGGGPAPQRGSARNA